MFETLKSMVLRLSKNTVHQTDRNTLRAKALDELCEHLQQYLVATRTSDGVAIEIPHDELGCIPAVVELTIKPLDFDLDSEHSNYLQDQQAKAEAKALKEKAKNKATK